MLYEIWSFNWSKLSQNHSNVLLFLPCSVLCRRDAHTGAVAAGELSTCRSSRRSSFSARRPYPRAGQEASPPFHPLSFLAFASRRHELELAAVRSAGQPSPLRFDSSHPEPRDLTPDHLRPSTSSAEPHPGRIERFLRGHHCCCNTPVLIVLANPELIH